MALENVIYDSVRESCRLTSSRNWKAAQEMCTTQQSIYRYLSMPALRLKYVASRDVDEANRKYEAGRSDQSKQGL
jgi:hypothetical protein